MRFCYIKNATSSIWGVPSSASQFEVTNCIFCIFVFSYDIINSMADEVLKFEDVIERDGAIIFPNKGSSMLPLIRQGKDLMVIEKLSGKPQLFDAVLFKRANGQYVLHRIMRECDGGYFIIGDSCSEGEFVSEEQIIGRLSAVIRGGKRLDVSDFKCRCYVFLVRCCNPVRKPVLAAARRVHSIAKKLKK